MNLVSVHTHGRCRLIAFTLCFLFLMTGGVSFSEQPDEKPDLSQPEQSSSSAILERFNSGFINVLSGPIEPFNHLREEVKQTDPVRGFIPGLVKGIAWFAIREGVGIYEMATCFNKQKPHLEPIDVDWLAA